MKFNSALYLGATSVEEKKHRREFLASHAPLLELLQKVVEHGIKDVRDSHLAADYSDVSWSHKQADVNGGIRAYTRMLEMLQIGED